MAQSLCAIAVGKSRYFVVDYVREPNPDDFMTNMRGGTVPTASSVEDAARQHFEREPVAQVAWVHSLDLDGTPDEVPEGVYHRSWFAEGGG